MTPTKKEIEVMRHALGADSRNPGYRNYYNADIKDELLIAMTEKGMVVRGRECSGGSVYYKVSDAWTNLILGP